MYTYLKTTQLFNFSLSNNRSSRYSSCFTSPSKDVCVISLIYMFRFPFGARSCVFVLEPISHPEPSYFLLRMLDENEGLSYPEPSKSMRSKKIEGYEIVLEQRI